MTIIHFSSLTDPPIQGLINEDLEEDRDIPKRVR